MKLAAIISRLKTPFKIIAGAEFLSQIDIADIAIDSRLVVTNSAFFAFLGSKNDGTKFIADAIRLGAKAIFLPENHSELSKITAEVAIFVGDNSAILAEILEFFYQPKPATIYGITGTNGKTSVAEYTRQILQIFGKNSASIGTLGIVSEAKNLPHFKTSSKSRLGEPNMQYFEEPRTKMYKDIHQVSGKLENAAEMAAKGREFEWVFAGSNLTTPDIISLHKNLQILKNAKIDDVAIEMSSIGLDQKRVAGLKVKVASFTNFTQDHLDYHGDMASYFAAKMLLFEQVLDARGVAVLNSDIPEFLQIKKICEQRMLRVIDYGRSAAVLCLIETEVGNLKFAFENQNFEMEVAIEGEFQAYNILCALGNVIAAHDLKAEDLKNLLPKLSTISAAPGRVQKVGELPNKARIFVDFAHSPDAITNVLKVARKMTTKKVLILFGCGGDRDAKKRPIMGKIASELADLVIISDDNPRTESPAKIRQEILAGIDKNLMAKIIEIPDRKTAILEAIKMLQANDLLILAGKGHEKYQIIGLEKSPFDEEKIVADAIK